jgi:hypothetical protein
MVSSIKSKSKSKSKSTYKIKKRINNTDLINKLLNEDPDKPYLTFGSRIYDNRKKIEN